MKVWVLVVVGLLIVLQTEIPDVAAQLGAQGASPWVFIGLRAVAMAVAMGLAISDPTGAVRAALDAVLTLASAPVTHVTNVTNVAAPSRVPATAAASVDGVAIHPVELSAAEVLEHYNAGVQAVDSGGPAAPAVAPATVAEVGGGA